jgi:hypothetical protein
MSKLYPGAAAAIDGLNRQLFKAREGCDRSFADALLDWKTFANDEAKVRGEIESISHHAAMVARFNERTDTLARFEAGLREHVSESDRAFKEVIALFKSLTVDRDRQALIEFEKEHLGLLSRNSLKPVILWTGS